MSNQDIFKGNWKSMIGAVKEKWGEITDNDLRQVEGNYDQLVGLIQKKAGQSRDKIEDFLAEFSDEAGSIGNRMTSQAEYLMESANECFHDTYDQVTETVERGYEGACDVVNRRPIESVAVVAGVALLGGLLLGLSLANSRR